MLNYLKSWIFGVSDHSDQTSSGAGSQNDKSIKPCIISVADVWASSIDTTTRRISGSLDMNTDVISGSHGECPFSGKYICHYKNFYLMETKYSWFQDESS